MAQDASETEDEKPKKGKGKLLIILGAVVVLAAGGGGAWFFMKGKGEDHPAPKQQVAAAPIFVNLSPASEPFVVNLQPASDEKYLQLGIDLKVSDGKVADAIKLHLPEIKNSVLLLLSSRSSAELVTADGKRKLASDLASSINRIIGIAPPPPVAHAPAGEGGAAPAPVPPAAPTEGVLAVLFTSFIIQ